MIYVYHRYFFAPGEKTFARANQKVLGGSISEAGGSGKRNVEVLQE